MNATLPNAASPSAPRFDRKFIEDHRLVERYLLGQLPGKGARDLEAYLRVHPEYLDGLKLGVRTQWGLKLLEAVGRPVDLQEARAPWWQSFYVPVACGAAALVSLLALWALFAKYEMLQGRLEDTRHRIAQGPLVQPTTERSVAVTPSRVPGGNPQVVLNRNAPELLDLHIDLAYTAKLNQFRLFIDKKDQGRALILNDLVKDSNNELRLTLNSTGLAAGEYTARIEALPFKGSPIPIGWLTLEVR